MRTEPTSQAYHLSTETQTVSVPSQAFTPLRSNFLKSPLSLTTLTTLSNPGLAYISSASSLPSTLSSIAWDVTTDSTTTWNVSTSNSTSVGNFFIDTSTYAPAGFTSTNTTLSTNTTTTGFSLFGGQVVFVVDSQYESQFWAQTTDTDGVWAVYWNANATAEDNSVPIVVKTLAPSVTTS